MAQLWLDNRHFMMLITRRLRIMQLVLSLSPGGTERLVIEICRRLGSSVDSTVCCLDKAGEWAPQLATTGIPVFALDRKPGFNPSLAVRVARLIERHEIDVLHCHHYSPFVYGALATVLTGLTRNVRLVFTEHGRLSNAPPSAKRRWVNPLLARLPGQVCAVSADLKRHMVAEGFPPDGIRVLYNGIDPGEMQGEDERVRARAELGVPRDAYVIGTAGRLDPVKNLSALVDGHAVLAQHRPGARLVIIGSGPMQSELEWQARARGIADVVHFTGYRADVRELMAAFDVYVNCSTYEGVSLTILEAMAAGLPVVATRVGGNPEVVVDGETGVLVPIGSPALTEQLIALAGNPLQRRALGAAGRQRAVRHFSIDRMVAEYSLSYQNQTFSANSNSAR
jgi:glycosyltransferase involved in cell wall biosynthesis